MGATPRYFIKYENSFSGRTKAMNCTMQVGVRHWQRCFCPKNAIRDYKRFHSVFKMESTATKDAEQKKDSKTLENLGEELKSVAAANEKQMKELSGHLGVTVKAYILIGFHRLHCLNMICRSKQFLKKQLFQI